MLLLQPSSGLGVSETNSLGGGGAAAAAAAVAAVVAAVVVVVVAVVVVVVVVVVKGRHLANGLFRNFKIFRK